MTQDSVEPIRIPIVSSLESRDSLATTDCKMVNCYPELVEGGKWIAVKRGGISFYQQATAGAGQGLVNFLDSLYSISGDTLNLNQTTTPGFATTSTSAGFTPRTGAACVGFLGKLWVMGGTAVIGGQPVAYNDVYSSLDGITWAKVTDSAPWADRAYASAIVLNGKLYVMGGSDVATPANTYGDVWSTIDGAAWVQENAAAFPAREQFGCCVFQNKMWVAGGRASQTDTFGNQTGYYNDVWSSVDGKAWVQVNANAPWLPRSRLGFAGFNGRLIVLGGEYSAYWQGAASDLWTSIDGGVTWTRSSSNPFSQAATGVFGRAVMTTLGANFWVPPYAVTLSGGGGTGATGNVFVLDDEDDGSESGGSVAMARIITPGSGYTSAPSIAFGTNASNNAAGYTCLLSNGSVGDKRGVCLIIGTTLYFAATTNAGGFSAELWQSQDGLAWTLTVGAMAFGGRDTSIISYGNLWIFGGQNALGYLNDVWSGNLSPTNTFSLPVTTPSLPFQFSQTSVAITSPLLVLKSTSNAFSYNPATALLSQIDGGGGNFPTSTVPGIVYLDGYFAVMDVGGKVYNSGINDPLTWTALGVIAAQNEPNAGAGIAKLGQYIVAFGKWSTTFFYDASVDAPASPFLPNPTYATTVGCATGYSIVEMQNTILWIGQSKKEGRSVYMMQDLVPVPVSTPFVDRILQADDLQDVRAYATEMNGHVFYNLTLAHSNITLVLEMKSQQWGTWTSRQPTSTTVLQSLTCDPYGTVTVAATSHGLSDGDPITVATASIDGYNGPTNALVVDANTFQYLVGGALTPAQGIAQAIRTTEGYFYCSSSAQIGGVTFLQHENNGFIFRLLPDTTTDFGNPIDCRTVTPNWDGGTRKNYKFLAGADLIADVVSSNALLRYTDDDYQSWSPYQSIDLSLTPFRVTRLGRFLRRAFQIRHTAATKFRGHELELDVELGN